MAVCTPGQEKYEHLNDPYWSGQFHDQAGAWALIEPTVSAEMAEDGSVLSEFTLTPVGGTVPSGHADITLPAITWKLVAPYGTYYPGYELTELCEGPYIPADSSGGSFPVESVAGFVSALLLAWAIGYVLGYKMRAIQRTLAAA